MAKKSAQGPLTPSMEAGLQESIESYFQDVFYNKRSRGEFIEAIDEFLRRQAFLALMEDDKEERFTKLSDRWRELTAAGDDGSASDLIAELLKEIDDKVPEEREAFSGLATLHSNFLGYQVTDRYTRELVAHLLTL